MTDHIHKLLIRKQLVSDSDPRGQPMYSIIIECMVLDCEFILVDNEIILYMAKLESALNERLAEEYQEEDHRLGGTGRTFDQFKKEVLK